MEDLLELNLRTDDRLEPSRELPNEGSFDDLWRQSEQTIAKHGNLICPKPWA